MSYRIAAALVLLPGAALAQDDPRTVGVSVAGTVVDVPVEVAAEACGVDAETLLAEWDQLGTEMSTMADTSVAADATDLAPEVAVDTPMDANIDGETVADGADATNEAGSDSAEDIASDGADAVAAEAPATGVGTEAVAAADTEPGREPGVPADGSMDAGVEATNEAGATGSVTGDDPATADAATSEEVAAAGTGGEAMAEPATPTEGTTLSKAAVCEVSQETADALGIAAPG